MKKSLKEIRKRLNLLLILILIWTFVCCWLLQKGRISMTLAVLSLCLLIAVYLIAWYVLFRCPHCGKNLDMRGSGPWTFCPHCGKRLEE